MNLKNVLLLLTFLFSSAFIIEDHPIDHKVDAKKVYKSNCRICHGSKGKLGINGATDLSKSTLNKTEIADVIANGRGVMTPFKDILDDEEIKAVAKYVHQLKK